VCGANSTSSGPKSAGVWTAAQIKHAVPPHDGAVGQRHRPVAVGQRHRPVAVDRCDLGSVDVDPPCQGGQRAADAQADAELRLPALPAGGRDRDPVARHAELETASIPTELDFGRYRHPREVIDSMSIETVDTRARAAAAVALVRQRAPETRFLPIAARPVPTIRGISR
jgi:hypothetical protein